MKMSVAMTTFNGEAFLDEQLLSLSAQSRLPDELIVSDDFSSDNTVRMLHAFAARSPFPVTILANPDRVGFRANFFRAIEATTGDIVAFCDQDDVWRPDKLAVASAAFETVEDVALVYHNATLIDRGGRDIGVVNPRRDPDRTSAPRYQPWSSPFGFSMLVRRDLFRFNDLWGLSLDPIKAGEKMSHDTWFFFLATMLASTIYLPKRLADYRIHGGNTAGTPAGWVRRLKLHHLRYAITAFRNIDKRISSLESRRRVVDAIAARCSDEERLCVRAYRARLDEHLGALRVQRSLYTHPSFRVRARSGLRLWADGRYGSHEDAKIERANRLPDLAGILLGPALGAGFDHLQSWRRSVLGSR